MNHGPAGDFPAITTGSYGQTFTEYMPSAAGLIGSQFQAVPENDLLAQAKSILFQRQQRYGSHEPEQDNEWKTTSQITMSIRRIVKVFIADPHQDVPMDKALLYQGEEKWTDATDQELFFEIPIKDLLNEHNKLRVTWLDKEATKKAGKDIFLEPVKIRDLKMVVVVIAQF